MKFKQFKYNNKNCIIAGSHKTYSRMDLTPISAHLKEMRDQRNLRAGQQTEQESTRTPRNLEQFMPKTLN